MLGFTQTREPEMFIMAYEKIQYYYLLKRHVIFMTKRLKFKSAQREKVIFCIIIWVLSDEGA